MSDYNTSKLPKLVGEKEAAEILGVHKQTLDRWLEPGSAGDDRGFAPDHTYMIPPKRVAAGPIWAREDVERHAKEIGRQRRKGT
jgi:hypothetical protein